MKLLAIILTALLEVVPAGSAFLKQLQPRDSILIADQLEYGFRLDSVKAGTALALPDFSKVSGDTLTVVRNWQVDTLSNRRFLRRTGMVNLSVSMVVAPFEEGEFMLPPIPVQRTVDGKTDTLVFDPAEFKACTMPVDTATFEIHDIKDQIRYPVTPQEIVPWMLALRILLALAGALAILIWARRSRRSGNARESQDPAHVVALRELDRYRSDKYWAPDRQKQFYSGITDALKKYIDSRFGVDAPEMTTAELFSALKSDSSLTPELFNELKDLFETADFVKFAKFVADDAQNSKALPLAVRFVTETYQAEIAQEDAPATGEEAGKD